MGQGTGSREQGVASKGYEVEPWLRGTHTDLDPVKRQIVHALELSHEDAIRWCAPLSDEQVNARPFALAPVAFHLRHIARSLDRLLSYAEGTQLDATQLAALHSELDPGATTEAVMAEFSAALSDADRRIRAIPPETYSADRGVGRAALPSTVGGLLVHCAEHTQRHIGQAITTAKIARAAHP
jgi:uncharacterized damage-inducible protein DinB